MEKKLTLNNVLTAFIAVAIPFFGYFGERALEKLDRTYDAVMVMKPLIDMQIADLRTQVLDIKLKISALEKRQDDYEKTRKP